MMQSVDPGELFVVATPIGNLEDITARALETLKRVHLVAAEDTRHAAALMSHFAINTPLLSYHEHNESRRAADLVARLESGENVALVSDAGTPLISDPGYTLVRAARNRGIRVTPVPGASALIAALSVSGLSTRRFQFVGFLSSSASQRDKALARLAGYEYSLVFYESTHRIADSLTSMARVLGAEREAAVCRELTKKFETIYSGSLARLARDFGSGEAETRGEFVIVVSGAESDAGLDPEWVEKVVELNEYMPLKQAARFVASLTGARSQALYGAASRLQLN